MLTPEQIEALADKIVAGHEESMVRELTERLVSSLVSNGSLTGTEMRAIEKIASMNSEMVNGILFAYRDRISRQTREIVEAALLESDDGDMEILTGLYPNVATAGSSAVVRRIAAETAVGVAEIIARDNLQMAAHAQTVWYDAASEAIVAYNHGAKDLDAVMTRAVNRVTRDGLTYIDYKSGVRNHIDVAVRRHVVTQVSQAGARMTEHRLDTFDHDLVQTSAHFGARPSHAAWQGQVFSRSGDGYPDFVGSTGYGTVTGLAGANCRHSFGPYFPGITELPELPETVRGMTNDEYYEATQTQRRHERGIRDAKREIAAANISGLDDTAARLKLGRRQANLRAFVTDKGLTRQPAREKAYGIGPSRNLPRALRAPLPKTLRMPDRPSSIMDEMDIRLPDGGVGRVASGTMFTEVEVFAGRGTSTRFEKAGMFVDLHGGTRSQWQHSKGYVQVYDESGAARRGNVHWYEEPTVGVVWPFVKGWSKKQ